LAVRVGVPLLAAVAAGLPEPAPVAVAVAGEAPGDAPPVPAPVPPADAVASAPVPVPADPVGVAAVSLPAAGAGAALSEAADDWEALATEACFPSLDRAPQADPIRSESANAATARRVPDMSVPLGDA
jgi:hypothetical protein